MTKLSERNVTVLANAGGERGAGADRAADLLSGVVKALVRKTGANLVARTRTREAPSEPCAPVEQEHEDGLNLVPAAERKASGIQGVERLRSLPDPSKRAVLSGFASAAVGMAVREQPATDSSLHPDAALLASESELEQLRAEDRRLCRLYSAVEGLYFSECSVLPIEVRTSEAEMKRLREKHNLPAIEEASDEANRLFWMRLHELASTRAKTLDGLKFKARWAEAGELAPSIIEDLLAL